MQQWLVTLVINYLFSQLANGVKTIDVATLAAEGEAAVNKFIPAFLQPMVDGVVVAVAGAVAEALQDSADLETVVEKLVAKDWAGALAALETLLGKVVHPGVTTVVPVVQALKAAA